MVQLTLVTVASVLTLILNSSIEISAECINERPQWIMQLGLRDLSSSLKPNQRGRISQSEIDTTLRVKDQQVICDPTSDNTINDAVKKSQLPLEVVGNTYYYLGTYFKVLEKGVCPEVFRTALLPHYTKTEKKCMRQANFFQAMEFCEVHGMNLLSIESRIENDFIITYLKANYAKIENFWTSGTDLGLEGEFVWMSTGKKFNFTYWSPGQPDNAGKIEHCLHLWRIKVDQYIWNDVPCTNNYNFICEPKPCSNLCSNDS